MTPGDTLAELLARVGARNGDQIVVINTELSQWPAEAVTALKTQRLLARARPAKSAACPGCERACAMPVQTLIRDNGAAASFVVCDKRDDINRVSIPGDLLKQWRCDAEAVCAFVAASLDIRRSNQPSSNDSLKVIGMTRGDERRQMLCLRVDGQIAVVAGGKSQPLTELVEFDNEKFSIDDKAVRALVDSATTSDSDYTPSIDRREERKVKTQAMYEDWRKAYKTLKKQRPNMSDVWYSRQIAKMDIACGRSADTIRKHIKSN